MVYQMDLGWNNLLLAQQNLFYILTDGNNIGSQPIDETVVPDSSGEIFMMQSRMMAGIYSFSYTTQLRCKQTYQAGVKEMAVNNCGFFFTQYTSYLVNGS